MNSISVNYPWPFLFMVLVYLIYFLPQLVWCFCCHRLPPTAFVVHNSPKVTLSNTSRNVSFCRSEITLHWRQYVTF